MSFIDKLKKNRDKTNNFAKEVVKIIFDQIIKKIEFVNSSSLTITDYDIPCFLFGYPVYNHQEITSKIISKLKRTGLKVKESGEISGRITIFW